MDALALYKAAEQDGFLVCSFDLSAGKLESLSLQLPGGRCAIAIDPNRVKSAADETVKLAHELGHCETESFYNRYTRLDVRGKHENHADKWAVKKLIPEEELKAAVREGHVEAWDLAEVFGVTEDLVRKAVCLYQHGNLDVEHELY